MVTPAVDLVAPVFRRAVVLEPGHGAVASAVLHVSSLGVHECYLDGVPVSADVLSPGWSAYEWRLRFRSHDLTALLHDGAELTVALGNGWWRGRLGFLGGRALYGDRLGLIAQLHVVFEDGHEQVIGTDPTWTAGPSDTIADDLYDGQTIDARRRDPDWDDQFLPAVPMDFDTSVLVPAIGPPVVRHETLRPQQVWTSPSGATLVDFGQNLVGWVRFSVQGPRGRGDPAPPRRGAGGRRARRPAAARRAGHRPVRPVRRRGRVRADASPSTGSGTSRSIGGPGTSRPTSSRRSSSTPTCAGPARSSAPTRCSTSCTATSCGGCAATSSTYRPTARSATSGWGGPATSPCSRPRRPSSTTSPASCATGWPTSPPEQRPRTGWCRSSSPTC